MSKIEAELLKGTGMKTRRGEKREGFLSRLIDAGYKLGDDAWADLSKDAQEWVNVGVQAEKDKQPVPDFMDVEPAKDAAEGKGKGDGEADAKDGASEMAKQAAAKKSGSGGSKKMASKTASASKSASKTASRKTASAAPRKQASPNGARKAGGMSAVSQLKHFLCDDPAMDKEKLATKLKAKGMKLTPVTISTIRSDFLAHCRVLLARGKLVKGFFKETQAKS